jgi:hypothetical protein
MNQYGTIQPQLTFGLQQPAYGHTPAAFMQQPAHPQQVASAPTLQHAPQSSSNSQNITDVVTALTDKLEILEQRMSRLGAPDLPNGGHARMFAAKAIATQVKNLEFGLKQMVLDGGTTHHVVRKRCMLFNMTASHINGVLVAGGAEHAVTCQGDIVIDTATGAHVIHGVLCVPTFMVNLMSVSQLDEQGHSILQANRTATVRIASGELIVQGKLL